MKHLRYPETDNYIHEFNLKAASEIGGKWIDYSHYSQLQASILLCSMQILWLCNSCNTGIVIFYAHVSSFFAT